MLRGLGLLAGWAAATVAVVGLGWAAVGAVTRAVTDPPPLAQPPVSPTVPPTAVEEPTPTGEPTATATAEPTAPATSPAPQERGDTRTFDMVGGTVGVRTSAAAAELVFATPQPGFSVDVRSRGPSVVDVRFSSDDHESRFRYDPEGGERLEERPD